VWRLQSRDGNPRFWRAVLRPVLARPAIAFTVGAGATLSALDFKQLGGGWRPRSLMALLGERNWYLPGWMHRLPMIH
jgi:hypothetical protein